MAFVTAQDLAPGWRGLLIAANVGVILGGLILVLSPRLGETLFYLVYFGDGAPPVPFPEAARDYIRFANGVLGAMMIGWVTLLLRLATMRPGGAPLSNWGAIRLSIGCWFVIDTGFSLLHGVIGNVLLNVVIALGMLAPLAFGRREAQPPETPPSG